MEIGKENCINSGRTFVILGAIQGVNNIVYGQDFSGLESLRSYGPGTNTSRSQD